MFILKRKIFLQETDATGVIYFASIFRYAGEVLEVFLQENNLSIQAVLSQGYSLPVVHAEADLMGALRAGDEVEIKLFLVSVSTCSFTLGTQIRKLPEKTLVGSTKIVHAYVLQGEDKASPVSEEFMGFLRSLEKV